MAHSNTPILTRITELETERSQIYRRAGCSTWFAERERLHEIRKELANLWDLRRQELAGAPEGAMPDVVRSATEFSAPRGARGYYRSRRHGGRTWAEAELIAGAEAVA